MHVLLLGATGRTGSLTLEILLKHGHSVTALVRNPDSVTPQPNLTLVKGTPLSIEDVRTAFASADASQPIDAVLVTLNSTHPTKPFTGIPPAPPCFMADSHANLAEVMGEFKVKKMVTMSAFGVASSDKNVNCMLRALLRQTKMGIGYEDHDHVDREMRGEDGSGARRDDKKIMWTSVRPVRLVEGEEKAVKEYGEDGDGVGVMAQISRETVAAFLVRAVGATEWDGRTVVISN